MTTTVYGTWVNYDRDALTPEATIGDALANAEPEWLEKVEETGAFQAMVDAYRDAIDNALPEGVNLIGEQFYGPTHEDTRASGMDAITEALDSIDTCKIIDDHDPDK